MMLRVVLRTTIPLAVAAVFCLPVAAQTASTQTGNDALPSSPGATAGLYGTPVEQIIARVNDQVITNSDLARARQQLDQEASQQNWPPEQLARQQKNLLRDSIDKQLLLSKGKELGITGDTQLIKTLDEIRKQNHLDSMEDLEKAVQQQGTSYEDFKANIRDNIITQNVVRDEVGRKLQASQAQLQQYYNAHKESFAQQESVHLSEILVPTAADATDAQLAAADAKAKEIEAKLKAGLDFAKLAREESGGPTAAQGGELGEFHRGALAKVLEDQTFSLPVGGFTQPIRTKQGYVILKVTQHVPGGIPTLEQVEPQVEEAVYMSQMEPAVRKYLTRLREEAYIDIRPGYVDTGASPNETKPIYSAYAAPQSKKKKKQEKARLKQDVRYTRYRGKSAPAALPGATAASASTGAATATTPSSSSVSLVPTATQKSSLTRKKKIKKEKIRYGRAPLNRVSEEQVATANSPAGTAIATPAAVPDEPADANMSTDAQPLGPDLAHSTGSQVSTGKTRLSDLARQKKVSEPVKKKHHTVKKKKQSKKIANPVATPNTDELATQKVQSAPLGLDGDTSKKQKKAKVTTGKPGEKTRMSDEKKSDTAQPAPASNAPASTQPVNPSSSTAAPPQQ